MFTVYRHLHALHVSLRKCLQVHTIQQNTTSKGSHHRTSMASAVEDDVTCPVCLEIFKSPVLLQCRHTLCSACSSLVENEPMSVHCPTCREVTPKHLLTHDFKTQNWVDLYHKLKAQESAAAPAPSAPPQIERNCQPEVRRYGPEMNVPLVVEHDNVRTVDGHAATCYDPGPIHKPPLNIETDYSQRQGIGPVQGQGHHPGQPYVPPNVAPHYPAPIGFHTDVLRPQPSPLRPSGKVKIAADRMCQTRRGNCKPDRRRRIG